MKASLIGNAIVFVAALLILAGSASAQQRAPVLTADGRDNNCGWGLAGAAAALAGAKLTDQPAKSAYTFTGFYVGGHLGCAWGDTDWSFSNNSVFSNAGGTTSFSHNNWIAGAQLGYNQQIGNWVIGVEASWSAGDFQDQKVNVLNPAPFVNSTLLTADIDSILTLTGRLGIAFNPRWMAYVKAGFASAEVDTRLFVANLVSSRTASDSSRHNGFIVGIGLDHLLGNNLVLGLEYSYMTFEDKSHQLACAPVACVPNPALNVDPDDLHVVVGRISYKFGSASPAPLK